MVSVRLYQALHGKRRRDPVTEIDRHAHIIGITASIIAIIVLACYAIGALA